MQVLVRDDWLRQVGRRICWDSTRAGCVVGLQFLERLSGDWAWWVQQLMRIRGSGTGRGVSWQATRERR